MWAHGQLWAAWNGGCASVLAQFSWGTDAVTEVCMIGFNWESCDHTCGGRKAVGVGGQSEALGSWQRS